MPAPRPVDDPVRRERELAWTGDAVLCLFARQWILQTTGRMDMEMFTALTCNAFLSHLGNPTRIESRIGEIYAESGLTAAFTHIETTLLPLFLKQRRNRARSQSY